MTSPLILGFDTSAAHCAAALVRGDTVLKAVGETMARGQAERLMGLLEDVLTSEGLFWQDVSALAVGTGPGNFTGIRIGVSAARGLALGLGIPCYGVTGFEARARLAPGGSEVTVAAPRGMSYVLRSGRPVIVPSEEVLNPAPEPDPAALAVALVKHAATLWPARAALPTPLYIKPPDAAPARDGAPPMLR